MVRFVDRGINLKRRDGTMQSLYDHWILEKDARMQQPRWSLLDNVLK
jgi:hypothetical protein